MVKPISPKVRTLLLAHVVGSYCAYFPVLREHFIQSVANLSPPWILVVLAPIFMPLYLAALTALHLAQYYSFSPQQWDYSFMPLTWACYTIPFAVVCLIRRKKTPFPKAAIIPFAITLFFGALWLHAAIVTSIPWRSSLEGKPAPPFTLGTLTGDSFSLSQERGHVVLLNFWSTRCPPCRVELGEIITKLSNDLVLRNRGLRVWTINSDTADDVRTFMNENHYPFKVMLDPSDQAASLYPHNGIPTTYLIARDGTVRKAVAGFSPRIRQQLESEIDAALK